jgi:hypothetical protein
MMLVQPQDLANVWPKVSGWIESALEYGTGDENALDFLIGIARGHYLLFHEPEKFALIAQIQPYPRQKVITVVCAGGGDLEAIRKGFAESREWCKAQGITVLRVWGREGWQRALNMTRKGSILQLELT